MLVDIASNTFYNCTATFRTHCIILTKCAVPIMCLTMVWYICKHSWVNARGNASIFMEIKWSLLAACCLHVSTWFHVCWPVNLARSKSCICWISISVLSFSDHPNHCTISYVTCTAEEAPLKVWYMMFLQRYISRLWSSKLWFHTFLRWCYCSDVFLFSVLLTPI
jgi:hypothetical protein